MAKLVAGLNASSIQRRERVVRMLYGFFMIAFWVAHD
jgi:hypothetical protein